MLLFVFKALHGTAPPYIADLIQTQKSKRTLCSESSSLLKVPRTYRKMRGDAPRLWNDLPVYIRQCSTLGEFKKTFKNILAFEHTWVRCWWWHWVLTVASINLRFYLSLCAIMIDNFQSDFIVILHCFMYSTVVNICCINMCFINQVNIEHWLGPRF